MVKRKETTNKGQIVEIEDTIHALGCGRAISLDGINYKCGNSINGFLFFCEGCNDKNIKRGKN